MSEKFELHPQTSQPIGLEIDTTPAQRPGPIVLQGRYGRLEKLKPEHAADLWKAFGGHDHIWTYTNTDGPFASEAEFTPFIAMRAAAEDPYAYAIIDLTDCAIGYVTLMRIVPEMRVIEVGHVLYSPTLQRTSLGTEIQYLLARYVFETLGYRRYEWKCNSLNAPSRRAALRFRLRRHIPSASHRQGQESQLSVVFHARQRMAATQKHFRALASTRKFRPRGPAKDQPGGAECRMNWLKNLRAEKFLQNHNSSPLLTKPCMGNASAAQLSFMLKAGKTTPRQYVIVDTTAWQGLSLANSTFLKKKPEVLEKL